MRLAETGHPRGFGGFRPRGSSASPCHFRHLVPSPVTPQLLTQGVAVCCEIAVRGQLQCCSPTFCSTVVALCFGLALRALPKLPLPCLSRPSVPAHRMHTETDTYARTCSIASRLSRVDSCCRRDPFLIPSLTSIHPSTAGPWSVPRACARLCRSTLVWALRHVHRP